MIAFENKVAFRNSLLSISFLLFIAMSRYPIFLRSLSPFPCTPPTVIRRFYSNSPSISNPPDKLILAAQRLVTIALDNSDGSIESNKRKREVEELQRALKEVEDGNEVSQFKRLATQLSWNGS